MHICEQLTHKEYMIISSTSNGIQKRNSIYPAPKGSGSSDKVALCSSIAVYTSSQLFDRKANHLGKQE